MHLIPIRLNFLRSVNLIREALKLLSSTLHQKVNFSPFTSSRSVLQEPAKRGQKECKQKPVNSQVTLFCEKSLALAKTRVFFSAPVVVKFQTEAAKLQTIYKANPTI